MSREPNASSELNLCRSLPPRAPAPSLVVPDSPPVPPPPPFSQLLVRAAVFLALALLLAAAAFAQPGHGYRGDAGLASARSAHHIDVLAISFTPIARHNKAIPGAIAVPGHAGNSPNRIPLTRLGLADTSATIDTGSSDHQNGLRVRAESIIRL